MRSRISRRTALKMTTGAIAASSTFHAPAVFVRNQTPSVDLIEVSWATWVTGPVDENNLVRDTLRERFNIDVEMLAYERSTWLDQVNTRIGGGDIPDIIYRDAFAVVHEFVEQGVLHEVPYDAVSAAAPATFAETNAFTTDVWLATYAPSDGKNYGIPYCQPSQTRPFTNGWRQDWLDKIGASAVPTTLDEHSDIFRRFVTESPSEAGLNYAVGFTGSLAQPMSWLSMAYGATPVMWMELENATLQHGTTMDGTRDALALMAQWYAEGIIDPEFLTTDGTGLTQKWANGQIGYLPSTWYRLIPGGEHHDALKAVNPEATISLAPPPIGPNGQSGYFNWGPITSSVTFGKNVDDVKLERLLGMMDAIQSDPELAVLLRFGIEGEHWARDPQTNAVIPVGDYINPANRGALGTNFFAAAQPSPSIQKAIARADEADLFKYAEAGTVKNFVPYATYLVPAETLTQASEMDPTRDQWLADFVSGTQPIDAWDQFLAEWNEAGGSLMTEAINGTYAELNAIREQVAAAVSG